MTAIELVQQTSHTEQEKSTFIKLLEAYQKMDDHAINDLLPNDAYYQDMTKTAFIYRQKEIFQEFKSKGDTHFNLSIDICTGCLCSEPVIVFTGNNSGHNYAIYIQFTQNEITDIYRCGLITDYFMCVGIPF